MGLSMPGSMLSDCTSKNASKKVSLNVHLLKLLCYCFSFPASLYICTFLSFFILRITQFPTEKLGDPN